MKFLIIFLIPLVTYSTEKEQIIEEEIVTLARQGVKEAQFFHGLNLLNRDPKLAMSWLIKAEASGCQGASGVIGAYNFDHAKNTEEKKTALKRVYAAAKGGDYGSALLLSDLLRSGSNMAMDLQSAYSWLYQASKINSNVTKLLANAKQGLTSKQISLAENQANARLEKLGQLTEVCDHSLPIQGNLY